jgi:hypothetical protein
MSSTTPTASAGRSVFFVLPRELRDDIYRLALTSPRDATLFHRSSVLFYRRPGYTPVNAPQHKATFTSSPKCSMKVPFNALQYVCRQLRRETHALHLAVNSLHFTDRHPAAINSCRAVEFFQQCAGNILSKIRRVEIAEKFPPPSRGISIADRRAMTDKDWFNRSLMIVPIIDVRRICKSHPKMSVTIRLRKITLDSMELVDFEDEAFVLGILSGKWAELPSDVSAERAQRIRDQAAFYRDFWLKPLIGDENLALDNFHFSPAEAEITDETAAYYAQFRPQVTVSEYTARMRQWHESGF